MYIKNRSIESWVIFTVFVIKLLVNVILLATFNSISEASRHSGIPKSTIGKYLKCGTSDQSEFIWKKTT